MTGLSIDVFEFGRILVYNIPVNWYTTDYNVELSVLCKILYFTTAGG